MDELEGTACVNIRNPLWWHTESAELLLLLLLLTAVEFSLGGSNSYTIRDKTNENKYTQTKQYKKEYKNTKHSKYKYSYYQTPTHTPTHNYKTSENNHSTSLNKHSTRFTKMRQSQSNQVPAV